MNATQAPLRIRPDIGGILHVLMTPENPLYATLIPAPMLHNSEGRPTHVDIDQARREHSNCSLVSYDPRDCTSIITTLRPNVGWYEPTPFQQRLIHAAITRALAPKSPREGIDL